MALGQLGKKTGQGIYRCVNGKPVKGAARRRTTSALIDALIEPYLHEAEAAVREGIVADADLADAGLIFGTGFAPFRGGPLHYLKNAWKTKLPEGKMPALRVMPMPADANQNGDIFGGWIMAQVDIAGGTVAGRLARGRVATVAVKEFVFKQPVQIGDLLSFYVDLERIGNTSITVTVEVYAERRPADPKVVKVTEATLTYVAIDRDGRPRPVPRA